MQPLNFIEAIQWARDRGVVPPDVYYNELQGLARSMAFSVAGITKLDQLQAIMDSLADATASGESFAEWRKRAIDPNGDVRLDLPPHRVESIFRTNIQNHYGRGRCEQQKRTADDYPYLLYDAVNDSRTRPAHAAMDGFIARRDDPIWQTWRPPCGYQCRCRVIALSERQAGQYLSADQRRLEDPDRAQARNLAVTGGPDTGWDYDICAEPDEGLRQAWEEKVGKAHPLLADAATEEQKTQPEVPEWPMLEGDQATLDEIKRLGRERLNDIFNAAPTGDHRTFAEIISAVPNASYLINLSPHFREELQRQLKEVRSIGGEKFNLENKSGKGVKLAERVASKFPDEWVKAANDPTKPMFVYVNENPLDALGFYCRSDIKKDGSYRFKIQTTSGSTAEHEFTHHLQEKIPALDKLFQEEHRRRTANDLLELLPGYGALGKSDKYIDAYFGREYDSSIANVNGGALEVITRSYQSILGEDGKANEFLAEMIKSDQDMLELALGALFHFKP